MKMLLHASTLLCIWSMLSSTIRAQTVQDVLWNTPNGKLADLSQTFTAGTTLALSWNAWPSPSYIDPSKKLVDLWVTAYDTSKNSFNQSLIVNLNLTSPGNYAWTITIPDSILISDAKYVLRFKVAGPQYDSNSGDLSSPGFLVLRGAAASSSSTSSSMTSSVTSSTSISTTLASSVSSLVTLSASSPPTSLPVSAASPSMTTGAKAGIGVGVPLAVMALAGFGFFAYIKGRKQAAAVVISGNLQETNQFHPEDTQYKALAEPPEFDYNHPSELSGTRENSVGMAELAGRQL